MTAMVMFTAFANAQTFTHRFSVQLISPANGSTHNNGSTLTQQAVVTLAQGGLVPSDTVAFGDPFTLSQTPPQVYVRTGYTKSQGDTIQFNYTYNGASATAGTANYCVRAYLRDGATSSWKSTFDTTGWRACNSVTFVGAPTGVNHITFENQIVSQQINVHPNPVVGNMINLDYVAQNASAVEVNVFDLAGRKVLSHSYGKAFKGQEGYDLNISDLNSGMYILELRQEGIKATAQFIK